MDVAKNIGGNLSVPVSDPLLPPSPTQAHHQTKLGAAKTGTGHAMSSESDSGSSSGEGESDVSDMVVDNSSKFAALSKKRRKSGESDYVPHEESRSPESQSESESESNSGQSEEGEEESDTSAESRGLLRMPPTGSLVRRLSDESDHSSSSSSRVTPTPVQQHQRASPGMSPLIKRTSNSRSSPFTKTNTRNILNDVTMRRHNYQLCPPKRQAAMNVKYHYYSEDEEDDEPVVRSSYQSRANRKRRRSPSGSEYEASDPTSVESSGEDSFIVEDDESDDDYRPRKRGAGGRGKRARVSN